MFTSGLEICSRLKWESHNSQNWLKFFLCTMSHSRSLNKFFDEVKYMNTYQNKKRISNLAYLSIPDKIKIRNTLQRKKRPYGLDSKLWMFEMLWMQTHSVMKKLTKYRWACKNNNNREKTPQSKDSIPSYICMPLELWLNKNNIGE